MNVEGWSGATAKRNKPGFDLNERLIDFAVRVIKVSEALPANKTGNHIRDQLLRSGTSPAANYAEGQGAESRADFIRKLKIALKELRETEVWLKIIVVRNWLSQLKNLHCLIAIMETSI